MPHHDKVPLSTHFLFAGFGLHGRSLLLLPSAFSDDNVPSVDCFSLDPTATEKRHFKTTVATRNYASLSAIIACPPAYVV
jgi:hypothetical protein